LIILLFAALIGRWLIFIIVRIQRLSILFGGRGLMLSIKEISSVTGVNEHIIRSFVKKEIICQADDVDKINQDLLRQWHFDPANSKTFIPMQKEGLC
jgi:hypothetical protein